MISCVICSPHGEEREPHGVPRVSIEEKIRERKSTDSFLTQVEVILAELT